MLINKIIDETGVKIDIEEDGQVFIYSTDLEGSKKALKMIENIAKEIEVGEVYDAKIERIVTFGAFASLPGGKEGLIHISKISSERVKKVEDVLHIGDEVKVKVLEIDNQGRINLTMKIDENKEEKETVVEE